MRPLLAAGVAVVGLLAACDDDADILLPDADAATFVSGVDNPWYPLPTGATWVYESVDDEGAVERITVVVLDETRDVNGVAATVVRDTVTLDGAVIEDTFDWFAQDSEGNVWYLGEDTCEYEDGVCVSTEGSWEWGVDGALPGLVMPAEPAVEPGPYYQEFYVGEAEDVGEVVAVGISAEVPAGSFDDCVRTYDTSTLDPDAQEFKVYCHGVGNVLVEGGDTTEELVSYSLGD